MILVNEASALEQMLIDSGGEITPEIENALVVKDQLLPEKIDNYSLIMERFEHLSEHYKSRAEMFIQIAKQCQNVQERLKENIKQAMLTLEVEEVQGFDIRFKLSKSKPKVVIFAEEVIPTEYKKEVTTIVVDKDKLREDLSIGLVSGAKLEQSYSLRTYANTPKQKSKKVTNE